MDTVESFSCSAPLCAHDFRSSTDQKLWKVKKSVWVKIVGAILLSIVLLFLISTQRFKRIDEQWTSRGLGATVLDKSMRSGLGHLSFDNKKSRPSAVRAGNPPLEVPLTTFQDCLVFSSTLCMVFPFEGCEYCKRRTEEFGAYPEDADFILEQICALALPSSICAHFPEVGACYTCNLMYPDGFPYTVNYK